MRDLDTTLRKLSALRDRPPVPPSGIEGLRQRARAIRRRRLTVLATPLVALLAIAGATAVIPSGDGVPVAVVPSPSTTPEVGSGFRVVPDTDLVDGQLVEIDLGDVDPGGSLVAAQCTTESAIARDSSGCDPNSLQTVRLAESDELLPVTVVRFVAGVDCGEHPRRCSMVLLPGTLGSWDADEALRYPISFDSSRLAVAQLDVRDAAVANGALTVVSGAGFPAAEEVSIAQCLPGAEDDFDRCDSLRSTYVTTDEAGRFSVKFQVSEEIRGWGDVQWVSCSPCVIEAYGRGYRAAVAIEVEPSGDPIRPRLEILEPSPYTPGQAVTLIGTGFQIGHPPTPSWCMLNTSSGYPDCLYPNEAFHPVEGHLEYRFPGFPMPSGTLADMCLDRPELECVITWIRGEGTPPAATIVLELVAP